MPLNLVLPRPRIATQHYIAIVLTVAVLCGLAGLSITFAGETIAVAQRIQTRGLEPIVLLARAEVLLEENGRLVDAAMLEAAAAAAAAQVQTYQANNAELGRLLQRLGYAASAPRSRRFEVAAAQGNAVFGLARAAGGEAPSQPRTMPPPATTCAAASAWSDSNGSTPPKPASTGSGPRHASRSCGYSLALALPAC
jgi:hypothetical protein